MKLDKNVSERNFNPSYTSVVTILFLFHYLMDYTEKLS